jgi:hypothetical protein
MPGKSWGDIVTRKNDANKLAAARALVKAKGDPPILAFDENGNPIGLIDPDDLTPIADSPKSDKPPAPAAAAPAAPATATADEAMVQKAVAAIAAALSVARFVDGPVPLVKSAGAQVNYSNLLKSLDGESQAVTGFALEMVRKRRAPEKAIEIAQSTAASVAASLPRSAVQKRTVMVQRPVQWAGGSR